MVLVAVIAFMSPNFRSEDARGAIGAVEKHRQPQITQSDVVLGDEQTKQDHQVLYGDFLTDAEALQNIAADIASRSESVESRAQVAVRSLDARYADLQVRYQQYAKASLAAMDQLNAKNQLAKADIEALSAKFADNLAVRDMEELGRRLRAMSDQLSARDHLAATASQIESFSWGARDSLEASPDLNDLQSAIEADSLGLRLRIRVDTLEAMAKEAKSLDAARSALQAKSIDNRALGKISSDLLAQAEQLEVRAMENMESSLASRSASVEALGRLRLTIDNASLSLDGRASRLDAKDVQAARERLTAFRNDLDARYNDMRVRSSVAMREQLAAMNDHLEVRSQVGVRANLASAMGDAQGLAQRVS
ncbi:MAG: hypothetical protein ACXW2P_03540, partial [Thermoanaerobaculia bacterium]